MSASIRPSQSLGKGAESPMSGDIGGETHATPLGPREDGLGGRKGNPFSKQKWKGEEWRGGDVWWLWVEKKGASSDNRRESRRDALSTDRRGFLR